MFFGNASIAWKSIYILYLKHGNGPPGGGLGPAGLYSYASGVRSPGPPLPRRIRRNRHMRIAIIGAELHGIEAAYLAKKAGFETLVIGKRKEAPALALADEYAVVDPATQENFALRLIKDCDAALPACENVKILSTLAEKLAHYDVPFLFDINAFIVSSSKSAANALMENAGIPIPKRWQDCGYPVIVKPASHSGGAGVTVAYNSKEVNGATGKIMMMGDEPLIQEYVSGRCVAVDVIGDGRRFASSVVTEGFFTKDHDCKMVRCSKNILNEEKEQEFR
jgi:pyrrolysine biosynthesis protein PylC